EKWDVEWAEMGVVTDGGMLRYFMHDELIAEVPAESLVLGGGAPVYVREQKEPAYFKELESFDPNTIPQAENHQEVIEFLVKLPSLASKNWVTQQYDSMVGTDNMSTNVPSDAAVIRIKGRDQALAVTTDCNPRYVYSNPQRGCALAVAEAARNLVCSGAKPLGVTNCLNFGNPHIPELYWQFAEAIKGMGDACRKFDTPVTGGNVSLYNQSETGAVFPTPTIGMVGVIDEVSKNQMTSAFQSEGDLIFALGEMPEDMGSSSYLYHYHDIKLSPAPHCDLDAELKLQTFTLDIIYKGIIQSAKDVSDGGLILCLLESAFQSDLGFQITSPMGMRKDAFLYGEAGGRIIVSIKADQESALIDLAYQQGMVCNQIGKVGGDEVRIDGQSLGSIAHYHKKYQSALGEKVMATSISQ
ncbi:MAG: hypothetical protein KAG66_05445, partial [Methylococcales bacterium]|nr:hypothetical protein [Methylococcales bacterium]